LMVVGYCSSKDILHSIALVSHKWNEITHDDLIWKMLCIKTWNLSVKRSVDLNLSSKHFVGDQSLETFYETWHHWNNIFGEFRAEFGRTSRCMSRLTRFLKEKLPLVANSLCDGIKFAPGKDLFSIFEKQLGLKIPKSLKMVYYFHNGQKTNHGKTSGVFGGYRHYDCIADTCLCDLEHVLDHMRANIPSDPNKIVFGFSFDDKYLLLDTKDDQVYVNGVYDGVYFRCTPPNYGLIGWLEEFTERLETGVFSIEEIYPSSPAKVGVCLFPRRPPLMSVAVTHAIRVEASAVFVPEHSYERSFMYTYSIRFMATEQLTQECQLVSRHWIIKDGNQEPEHVRGDGVIGEFPFITPGNFTPFIYQSRTSMRNKNGTMKGDFQFVPGRIQNPQGPIFDVECAEFSIIFPDFIF